MKSTYFSSIKAIIFLYLQCFFASSLGQLEEGKFLLQISDQYSSPLVVSFLHARILNNKQMIDKIESSLNLDQPKKDFFDLSLKCLDILDDQLVTLQKANYFDFNGTSKVKYFIELYNMYSEMYPVELGLNGIVSNGLSISTSDSLNKFLSIKSNDQLIIEAQKLTQIYLKDLDTKIANEKSNRLQKLAATLTKSKLESLANYFTVKPVEIYDSYIYKSEAVYNTRSDIAETLHKYKLIARLFYTIYARFEDEPVKHPPESTTESFTTVIHSATSGHALNPLKPKNSSFESNYSDYID